MLLFLTWSARINQPEKRTAAADIDWHWYLVSDGRTGNRHPIRAQPGGEQVCLHLQAPAKMVAGPIEHQLSAADAKHVYRHFQKRLVLSASYDEFWKACGGRLAADGMFDLPVIFFTSQILTIRANKRQMYKRRYAMLSEVANQIRVRVPKRLVFISASGQCLQIPVRKAAHYRHVAASSKKFENSNTRANGKREDLVSHEYISRFI